MQKGKTLFQIVEEGKKVNKSGVFSAVKRGGKWIETSPEEFFNKVRWFALALHDLGIKKGDRIALHSENSTEWFISDQAILSLGAVNVPIYTTQPGDQIKYILEDSEARIYIYSTDKLYDSFRPFADSVENLEHRISIISTNESKALSFDDLLEKGKALDEKNPELFSELQGKVSEDDLASFIYTSGTTGLPKGVMLTHGNITSNVMNSISRIPFDIDKNRGGKLLSYLPLSHIFERMLNYLYYNIGYSVWYIEEVEQIKDDLNYVKPIFFATVPRLLEKIHTGLLEKMRKESGLKQKIGLWAMDIADNYDMSNPPSGFAAFKHKIADKLVYSKVREGMGGNLLGMISGGAALATNLMNFYTALGFMCHQGYGLTETSPVICVTTEGATKAGSVGKVIDGVEVKIAEDGEILCKGPNVMKGYFKNPEATREVLSEDGWFHTGDVGEFDTEGFLYITDRKKDIFKLSTGKYVAPQHVENTMLKSRFIEQSVVLGAKQKFCSALIVPNMDAITDKFKQDGVNVSPNDDDFEEKVRVIIQKEVDTLNEKLPKWEQIKRFALLDDLFSIESGELTPTMKTKRRVIHEKYKMQIERIYEEQ